MPRNEKAIRVLTSSTNTRELARAAQELAASADADDQAALGAALRNSALQARLDPPDADYAGAEDLNIARPLRTLAGNRSPLARGTLTTLINDATFTEDPDRFDLLLRATATWRPPDPVVVAFWRRAMDPDDVHFQIAVAVATENATEPAVAFFESCLRDARYDDETKISWMRRPLLMHRVEEPFLKMSERLLSTGPPAPLARPLQAALVEALFDFKQEEWYPPHSPPVPPRWTATTPAGRDILRRIAAYARNTLGPGAELETAIKAVVTQLDAIDGTRPR
ncbi:MAG TPA: hypothetical protein VFX89_08445 [Gammaproteobacteria bacterium]|nr:hypothetical protein [Gammaproteobacteria bacterium]